MANSPASQERPVSQMVDECRYVAHELEVYGAEDEPQVNVHKKLFRLAAALIRRNADALRASEERIAGLTGELEKNREVSIAASEQVLNLSTERVAWRKREQRLRALCEEYRDGYRIRAEDVYPGNGDDVYFLAHAREDVPKLLEALRVAYAEIDRRLRAGETP